MYCLKYCQILKNMRVLQYFLGVSYLNTSKENCTKLLLVFILYHIVPFIDNNTYDKHKSTETLTKYKWVCMGNMTAVDK